MEATKSILEGVLMEYEPISKAPSLGELERRAAVNGIEVEYVLKREAEKRYKAVDLASGSVYLVQNPAAWSWNGTSYIKAEPEYQCSLSDARKYGTTAPKGNKKAGAARDSF